MIDYNFLVMARSEYEERVRKVEAELMARNEHGVQPSAWSRALYGLGEWLEGAGARLKAQHQPIPMHHNYHGGHAS